LLKHIALWLQRGLAYFLSFQPDIGEDMGETPPDHRVRPFRREDLRNARASVLIELFPATEESFVVLSYIAGNPDKTQYTPEELNLFANACYTAAEEMDLLAELLSDTSDEEEDEDYGI